MLETVASVLAFVYRGQIEKTLKGQLLYVIKEKWSETDEEGWKEGWAYTQHTVCSTLSLQLITLSLTSTWPHLNSDVGLEEGEY